MKEGIQVATAGLVLLALIYGAFKVTGDSLVALMVLLGFVAAFNCLPFLWGHLLQRYRMNRRYREIIHLNPCPLCYLRTRWNPLFVPTDGTVGQHSESCTARAAGGLMRSGEARTSGSGKSIKSTPPTGGTSTRTGQTP